MVSIYALCQQLVYTSMTTAAAMWLSPGMRLRSLLHIVLRTSSLLLQVYCAMACRFKVSYNDPDALIIHELSFGDSAKGVYTPVSPYSCSFGWGSQAPLIPSSSICNYHFCLVTQQKHSNPHYCHCMWHTYLVRKFLHQIFCRRWCLLLSWHAHKV